LGFTVGGMVVFMRRVLKLPLPTWMVPIAAAVAMLSYHVWQDYNWHTTVTKALPETVVVTQSYASKSPLQPWTYVVPRYTRFIAVDKATMQVNPNLPGMVLAEMVLVQRYNPAVVVRQIVDCKLGRNADLLQENPIDETGMPTGLTWRDLGLDDPKIAKVCTLAESEFLKTGQKP
jgi:hypothetical protein